jgi:hypothetical protein
MRTRSERRASGHHGLHQLMHDPVDIRRPSIASSRASIVATTTGNCWRVEPWSTPWTRWMTSKPGARRNAGLVWAMLARTRSLDELGGARRYRDLLAHAVPLAVELRHEPILIAGDGDEMVCSCGRCSALGYGSAAVDVVGGALFEDACPNEDPPKLTALTMMRVSGSRWPGVSSSIA